MIANIRDKRGGGVISVGGEGVWLRFPTERLQSSKKGLWDRACETIRTGLAEEDESAKDTEKEQAGGQEGNQEGLHPRRKHSKCLKQEVVHSLLR